MYFLYVSLFVVFSEKIFGASFNQQCSSDTNCHLPGLMCVDGRCVCDWKSNLFWTNARCLACPKGWMRTETRCVIYMGTQLPWAHAQATCIDMESELLSYRTDSTVSLIYQLTATTKRRKRQVHIASDKSVVWTSGHAVETSSLDLYQWADTTLPSFNSKSSWWCKEGMYGFAFYYQFNEPTRLIRKGELEKCLLSRRGTTNTMVICLDDVLCEEKYPFICEKSESTAQTYIGPPPTSTSTSTTVTTTTTSSSTVTSTTTTHSSTVVHTSTTSRLTIATTPTTSSSTMLSTSTITSSTSVVLSTTKSSTKSTTSSSTGSSTSGIDYSGDHTAAGGVIARKNLTAFDQHDSEMKPSSQSQGDDDESHTPIILFIVFGLLLLIGVLVGIFYFRKRHAVRNTQPTFYAPPPPPPPQPQTDPKPVEIPDVNPVELQRAQSDEIGLALNTGVVPERVGFNIGNQKQQKNKKGGFTTQQFADELE